MDQYLYIYSVLLRLVILERGFRESGLTPSPFSRYAKNKAERDHIQLDMEAAERLIQAIARRIYKQPNAEGR
jgi:hypothetical protein